MNIWTDCEKKPLTECLKYIVDNRGKTVPTSETGIILIATNCISNDSLYPRYEKIRYLSKETYDSFFRAHPIAGDIIFVNKGTPGRVCMVPNVVDFCIAQDMIALRVNEKIIDNYYLLSILRSREIQSLIANTNVGDVIPHFKKQFLNRLLIPIPELSIQKKIGYTYRLLSIKIETNNKLNEKLEEMAQAIFKSWFVDFEPFKNQPFHKTELGMIPKGWEVGIFEDIANIVGGGTPSKQKQEYYTEDGIAWLTPKDLSLVNKKFTSKGAIDITKLGYEKSSAKLMPKGSVLFSSRAPIGYITIAKNEICTNQGFKSAVPQKAGTAFIYYLLKNKTPEIENMATGSTFKEASGTLMKTLRIIIPIKEVLDNFEKIMEPIFNMQLSVEEENDRLASLRDTLLPRLMSGEIKI